MISWPFYDHILIYAVLISSYGFLVSHQLFLFTRFFLVSQYFLVRWNDQVYLTDCKSNKALYKRWRLSSDFLNMILMLNLNQLLMSGFGQKHIQLGYCEVSYFTLHRMKRIRKRNELQTADHDAEKGMSLFFWQEWADKSIITPRSDVPFLNQKHFIGWWTVQNKMKRKNYTLIFNELIDLMTHTFIRQA